MMVFDGGLSLPLLPATLFRLKKKAFCIYEANEFIKFDLSIKVIQSSIFEDNEF